MDGAQKRQAPASQWRAARWGDGADRRRGAVGPIGGWLRGRRHHEPPHEFSVRQAEVLLIRMRSFVSALRGL
jgi:hypothetical protein